MVEDKDEKDKLTSSLTPIHRKTIEHMAQLVSEIIKRRRVLGLTQQEVANRAGLTQAQVARLETGNTVPKWDTVMKVAFAVGLTMNVVDEEASAKDSPELLSE